MKRPPFITGDGQLVDVGDVHFNQDLAAPQVQAVMRFARTSDALRGLVRDMCNRAYSEGRPLSDFIELSGRSGHSRIGIDVRLQTECPLIDDRRKSIEFPVEVMALNRLLGESLSDLTQLALREAVDIGRLFIPMSEPLSSADVGEALERGWLLLPRRHAIGADGAIDLPLEPVRYVLSERLLTIPHNFTEMVLRGKHGLGLFQHQSPVGLPELFPPREFLVGAVRIALGPYTAFIDRRVLDERVFHLASRLLDGIRTTGMGPHRHVELYNCSNVPVANAELRIRIRLYPADDRVAQIAARLLLPGQASVILLRGVDFAELTDIFNPRICSSLFDEVTSAAELGGSYGRLLMPGKMVNIPWEEEDGCWIPEFQWRLVYETARGNVREGVLDGEEIPRRFRNFLDELRYVGGEQKLSKVFIADSLPPLDTLRVLKRNGFGVVVLRSINSRTENGDADLYFDQAIYEELLKLEAEGVRFYLLMENDGDAQVREFHHGFWVTAKGKERFRLVHTTLAVFGSSVQALCEAFTTQFETFLEPLAADAHLGPGLAVAHGSGPGIMQAVDEAAAKLGIFRLGVGIDGEKIGQAPNLAPEALVQFRALAMNTRQDILDRRSIFKIFNVGGFGTCYEINMALTFMKIGHCLPAPYIFVDPLGLGPDGAHLWEQSIRQFQTITEPYAGGSAQVGSLGPAWVARCCHLVRSYQEGLGIMLRFVDNPGAYWDATGISRTQVARARDNLTMAGVPIPPYIEEALGEA